LNGKLNSDEESLLTHLNCRYDKPNLSKIEQDIKIKLEEKQKSGNLSEAEDQ